MKHWGKKCSTMLLNCDSRTSIVCCRAIANGNYGVFLNVNERGNWWTTDTRSRHPVAEWHVTIYNVLTVSNCIPWAIRIQEVCAKTRQHLFQKPSVDIVDGIVVEGCTQKKTPVLFDFRFWWARILNTDGASVMFCYLNEHASTVFCSLFQLWHWIRTGKQTAEYAKFISIMMHPCRSNFLANWTDDDVKNGSP